MTMDHAIEILQCERLNLRALVRTVERNEQETMCNIPHDDEDRRIASLDQALEVLQACTPDTGVAY
jgi:hypothetical protein